MRDKFHKKKLSLYSEIDIRVQNRQANRSRCLREFDCYCSFSCFLHQHVLCGGSVCYRQHYYFVICKIRSRFAHIKLQNRIVSFEFGCFYTIYTFSHVQISSFLHVRRYTEATNVTFVTHNSVTIRLKPIEFSNLCEKYLEKS